MSNDTEANVEAVIYAAKSTEDRKGSIDGQIEACRRMADREGWTVIDVQRDEGFSAYKRSRGPGLEAARRRAIEAARASGREVMLLAVHSDRFARGSGDAPGAAMHLGELYFVMARQNVRLRSVEDDSNLEDVLRAVLIGERNTEDSRRKSEAVKAGKRRQFERGFWSGGPAPDGYKVERRVNEDGSVSRSLLVDPERAEVIRLIFSLAEAGHGDPTIARRLNEAGKRTKAHRVRSGRNAGKKLAPGGWTRRRVQDTLTNPIYAGAVVWHRGRPTQEVNPNGRHEALVDPELFERLQVERSQRDKAADGRPRGGRKTTRYLLARLAECGRCGAGMYASTSPYVRKDGSQQRRYVCANVHQQTGLCDAPPIDAASVDPIVTEYLHHLIFDHESLLAAAESAHAERRETIEGEHDAARAELKTIDRDCELAERDYLRRLRKGDSATADAISSAMARLHEERQGVMERLGDLQARLEELTVESPADAALDTYNERRAAFERIRDALTVEDANDELRTLFRAFRLATWPELDRMQPTRGAAVYTVTIDPILLEDPDNGIRFDEDDRGEMHYRGPDLAKNPPPIETGSYSHG